MFLGLLSVNSPLLNWGDPASLMTSLVPFAPEAPRAVWFGERQMLCQVSTHVDDAPAGVFQDNCSGVVLAFWGRLDCKDDLIRVLDADPDASNQQLVVLAWLRWGEHCPEKLIGDFAFALASTKTGVVFLARDVMGVKPLYYRANGDGVYFANSVSAFKPLKLGALTPSRKWMSEYLLDMSWSHTDTAYEEVKKLPGAHCLLIQADGSVRLRRYHRFVDDAPEERQRDNKWLDAYRASWQQAVACRLPDDGAIASENSGGLDSGSITSEVARQLGDGIDRLHTMAFCYQQQEPEYIMATPMQWYIKHNSIFSHDQSVNWNTIGERELKVNGYPMEHGNGAFHFPFYELCQQNSIHTLLSGFGGDEATTYAGGIPARLDRLDNGDWHGLWRIMKGRLPMKIGRTAKALVNSRKVPQFSPHLIKAWQQRWPHNFLGQDVLEQYDLERNYFSSATYDERFRKVNDAALYMISRPHSSIRLENCTLMAASFGVDYAWPLWDQRLVQQWLSTPAVWKVGDGGIGRYLHRMAVNGVCPDKVAWKPNKDMGYADNMHMRESFDNRPLFRQAFDLLEGMPIELLNVVDTKKLHRMAEQGLREDWRGMAINYAWSTNLHRLDNLKRWLHADS